MEPPSFMAWAVLILCIKFIGVRRKDTSQAIDHRHYMKVTEIDVGS